jgi:hypothetical protein
MVQAGGPMTDGTAQISGMAPTVGVLFVHGIGEQKQGETLLRFGEPLFKWLREWIEQASTVPNGDFVEIGEVSPVQPQDATPAHVELTIHRQGDVVPKLLIAESWWADVFIPARFTDVALWGISFIFTVVGRVSRRMDRALRQAWEPFNKMPLFGWVVIFFLAGVTLPWILGIAAALFAADVALVVGAILVGLLLIVGLTVLAFVPPLRPIVVKIQLAVANSAGDAYVLMHSPFSLGAMASRVQRDVKWLESRTDKVLVVGHSQGSVVAYEALLSAASTKLAAFITVGSAMNLLEHGSRRRRLMRGHAGADSRPNPQDRMLRRLDAFRVVYPQVTWHDFWTPYDPVCAGPLVEGQTDGLIEHRLDNRASPLRDHSLYPDNAEQFLAPLGRLVCDLVGVDLSRLRVDDTSTLNAAAAQRKERVQFLSNARLNAILCGLVYGLALGAVFVDLHAGKSITTALQLIPGPASSWLQSFTNNPAVEFALGFLTTAVILGLFFRAVVALWSWWDRIAWQHFVSRAVGTNEAEIRLGFQAASLVFPTLNLVALAATGMTATESDAQNGFFYLIIIYGSFALLSTFVAAPPLAVLEFFAVLITSSATGVTASLERTARQPSSSDVQPDRSLEPENGGRTERPENEGRS